MKNNLHTRGTCYFKSSRRFAVDREIEDKLLLTTAPEGYLKCIED